MGDQEPTEAKGAASSSDTFVFGAFEFDCASGLLRRGAQEIPLPPRAVAVLGMFLRRPGELLSKDQLIGGVWKDAFVGDDSLTQAISVLRQALDDDSRVPTYIQTIPRRGYRFIAAVTGGSPKAPEPLQVARSEILSRSAARPWGRLAAGLLVAVTAIVGTAYVLWRASSLNPVENPSGAGQAVDNADPVAAPTELPRVVVADFENDTGDPELDSLGGIVAYSIGHTAALAGLAEVVPTDSLASYATTLDEPGGLADTHGALRRLAAETAAEILITGNYLLQDGALVFQPKIAKPDGSLLVPVGATRGPREDSEEILEDTVDVVLGALAVLHGQTVPRWSPGLRSSVPGLRTYQIVEEFMQESWVDQRGAVRPYEERRRRLVEALEGDPGYFWAQINLAFLDFNANRYDRVRATLAQLNEQRDRWTSFERSYIDWFGADVEVRHGDALAAIRRGLEWDPRSQAHIYSYGSYALLANRPAETIAWCERHRPETWIAARHRLGQIYFGDCARAHHALGQYDLELQVARRGRELYPDNLRAIAVEIRAHAARGDVEAVSDLITEGLERLGGWSDPPLAALELEAHGYPEAAAGMAERAVDWLLALPDTERPTHSLAIALWLADRTADARSLLERAATETSFADPAVARESLTTVGLAGALAAWARDHVGVERALATLDSVTLDPRDLRGEVAYWRAAIRAQLGEFEAAVAELNHALASGWGLQGGFQAIHNLHIRPELAPLRGYEPLLELLRTPRP